jgi:hypothetical protein
LDPAFNGGTPLIDSNPNVGYSAMGMTADGYYLAGIASGTAFLRRVTRDGSFDVAFKGGSIVPITSSALDVVVHDIVPLSGGRVALAAGVDPTSSRKINVTAYTGTGDSDLAFGTVTPRLDGGVLLPGTEEYDTDQLMYRDCEGRLIVTGTFQTQFAPGVAGVARILDDGGIDSLFGNGGLATIEVNDGGSVGGTAAEDPITGRILVATAGYDLQLVLVRLFR